MAWITVDQEENLHMTVDIPGYLGKEGWQPGVTMDVFRDDQRIGVIEIVQVKPPLDGKQHLTFRRK